MSEGMEEMFAESRRAELQHWEDMGVMLVENRAGLAECPDGMEMMLVIIRVESLRAHLKNLEDMERRNNELELKKKEKSIELELKKKEKSINTLVLV